MKLNKKNLSFIGVIFAVLVLVTLFLPLIKNGDYSVNGLSLAIGRTQKSEGFLSIEYGTKLNISVLLAYLAVIGAAVLLLVEPKNAIIAVGLFAVAAVLFVVGPTTVTMFIGGLEVTAENVDLGWGAYVAIILSAFGALTSLYAALGTKK